MNLYENDQFSAQQKRLLRKAEEQGLNISSLLNPELTYAQMEVLYQALLYDIDIEEYAKPSIPVEEMKSLIKNDKQRKQSYKLATKNHRISTLKLVLISIIIVSIVSSLGVFIYGNKENIGKWLNPPKLTLVTEDVYYNLSKTFDPYSYIKDSEKDITISIQGIESVQKIGKHQLIYSQSNGIKSTKRTLIVYTVDDIAPTLELTSSKITLSENGNFNPKDYIKQCNDNIDGDLVDKVFISNYDPSKDVQNIIYKVKDSSGNESEQTLIITKEKVPDKEIVYVPEGGGGSSASSGSQSSSNANTNGYSGKFYSIDDYNSFDECLNVCMRELGGRSGSCVPEQNSDGVWTGYRMYLN